MNYLVKRRAMLVRRGLRIRTPWMLLICALVAVGGCGRLDPTPYLQLNEAYQVTIERDSFGVPHVLGQRDVDTAFGFAYAQAEDNWQMMQETLAQNRGVRAKYEGPDAAPMDILVHSLGIWDDIEARYDTELAQSTRDYIEAFADGLNYYAAKHPQQTNADLIPITGRDIVAGNMFRHSLFFGLNDTLGELTKAERQRPISQPNSVQVDGVPIGSNAFAVAPHYSTDGATRLAINSHQPTTGPVAWYEAHIRSEEGLDIMGGLFPGAPTVSLGFNQHLGWGVTVNKPDLVDVYVLTIDPENPARYQLDGAWLELESHTISVDVLLWGFLPWSVDHEVLRSVHGPVLRTDHGTYAIRYAGIGEMRQVEQWLAMNKAQDFTQWRDAMRLHRFASFNFVYADAAGNIMFVHNSQTPKRVAGYDWKQYLPGNDSSLIWNEYLSFDELPQVVNPQSGYVLSTNQTPFMVSGPADNPKLEDFSVSDGYQTRMTNRTNRGLELLSSLGPISAQEFFDIKHDKAYSSNSRAGRFLQAMADLPLASDVEEKYRSAQDIIRTWDRSTDAANPGAALGVCAISEEWTAEQRGLPPPLVEDELFRCTDLLLDVVGRLDPPWGEVNRHVRGDLNLPVAGGPDTLRAIYGTGLPEEGYLTNVGGDGLYYLVSWPKEGGVEPLGIHQFGSATLDATSKHYADQTLAFSQEALRNPWFDEEQRAPHVVERYSPGER